MPSDWKYTPLGDILILQRGHDLPSAKRQDGIIPIIGSAGIAGYHNEAKMSGPGVVIGRSGNSMGNISFIDIDYWPLNTGLYIKDFKGNNHKYIYYLLQTINFDQFNSGSAQKSLNRNFVYPHKVYITTSILEQTKIAHILSTLDDKIELNRKMNQTLEEMDQTLYKSWFVDFDPVYVKVTATSDAEIEKAAAELGLSKEILNLFPSELEESKLGMIPKGWKASDLSYIFIERKEKVKDKTNVSVMSVVQTGEIVNSEGVFSKQVHSKDISNYKLLYPLDLGYNPSRINIGSAGFNKSNSYGAMSPVYTVMKFNDEKFHPFMELFMKKATTKKWIEVLASGSVRQSLSQKDFLSIPVVIPSDNVLEKFNSVYASFQEKIEARRAEIVTLENIRDILLPKLLSGELDVSEVEI